MTRGAWLVPLAALAVVFAPAIADADKKDSKTKKVAKEEPSDEEPDPVEDPEDKKPEKKPEKKKEEGFVKQDLTGHDLSGSAKGNMFEKDRFFVDKVDSSKTKNKTLIQGNLTSTTFAYTERGGNVPEENGVATDANVPAASQFSRIFTDLRLQTDFRHIGGSKWDSRIDVRARAVTDPGSTTQDYTPATNSTSQSGLLGQNELEVRELWIMRGGKRSDVIFGRQFVPDLAGIKFDGLRIDYASSEKFTMLGFGGLYPIRGSRSITTDYQPLVSPTFDLSGSRPDAGKFTGAGGFGAAYRTPTSYGAFGGVALVPFEAESPRIFGTSTGYWRPNPKVDLYHMAVLDLVGPNDFALTNLSGGLNYKPDQRLRATLSINRVDTETLNVQANAFLQDPNTGLNSIQNEAFLIRVAQNAGRASLSAGLGSLQRFEITVASALRYRGEVTITAPVATAPVSFTLPAGKSVEVYGGITDRRSFKKLRLGIDASRILSLGGSTYQRATSNSFRVFASRELKNGHGEWESEVMYTKAKDDSAGTNCVGENLVLMCYGSSTSSSIGAGGNLYYRFNRDWLLISSLFLSRQTITSNNGATGTADPTITGLTGFVRVAYRF